MRRPIPLSRTSSGGASWLTTPWVVQDASGAPVPSVEACGDYAERRDVTCVKAGGALVDDYFCSAVPKPPSERRARHDEGCSYSWSHGDWVDPGSSCSLAESQTREVTCRRDSDHAVMDDDLCGAGRPDAVRQVADFSTCSHSWHAGDYVDPGAACSDAEVQIRPVTCVRDLDLVPVDGAMCDPATRPAADRSVRDVTACTYAWSTGDFVDPGASCTRAETQTRSVSCRRSLGDEVVDDALCAGAAPATTQTVPDYATCSFSAVDWTGYTPSSTCSADATKTRTARCRRSNDGGEIVDDAQCAAAHVVLSETLPEANYSTCASSWDASGFVDPGASCGTETWSQTVTCRRDLDRAVMPDASCAGVKPATTDTRGDVSGCGYSAVNWTGYSPSSTCSANAVGTRTAQCRRGDGAIVDASECTSRGIAVSESVPAANYSGCSHSWAYGAYADPGASCTSSEVQYRTAWCRRDVDGVVVDDSLCAGVSREALSTSVADYSGCTFQPVDRGRSACVNNQYSQYWDCTRSDGLTGQHASNCGKTNPEIVACVSTTYDWSYGPFVDPGRSCTSSETQTRSVTCVASPGGSVVADGNCSAGTRQSATQTAADFSGCTFQPVDQGRSACTNNQYSQYWDCTRSDGLAHQPAANCGKTNPEIVACDSYTYRPRDAGAGACAADGTRLHYWDCTRSDGATGFPASMCGHSNPETETCSGQTSTYTYQARDAGAGACAANGTRPHYWDCTRSDGATGFPASMCGHSNPETEACGTVTPSYTYAWTYSGATSWNSSCSSAAQRTQQYYCRREQDGASVGGANCSGGDPSYPETAAVYSGCSYTTSYGAWGACSGGTQYRSNACTRNQTGEGVDPQTFCGVSSSQSQGCAMPAAYSWSCTMQKYTASGVSNVAVSRCARSDGYVIMSGRVPPDSMNPQIETSYLTNQSWWTFDNAGHQGYVTAWPSSCTFTGMDGSTTPTSPVWGYSCTS